MMMRVAVLHIASPVTVVGNGDYLLLRAGFVNKQLEPGCMDTAEIRRRHPHITLIGNIDVDALARGTPEQVRGLVRECFEKMGGTGRLDCPGKHGLLSLGLQGICEMEQSTICHIV